MCADTSSAARRPNLPNSAREAARVRHLSYRTEKAYLAWIGAGLPYLDYKGANHGVPPL